MNDLISVIIPCFEQGRFLTQAVSSLISQTYPFWEAIIVNDGSTDETELVADKLCKTDKRIKYISKENGGLSSARNAGLLVSKGEWIQFLDADDLIMPSKFEKHLAVIKDLDKNVITYTNYFHGDYDNPFKRVSGFRVDHELILSKPLLDMATRWEFDLSIPIHAPLFPAWPFKNHHVKFDEALSNHEDWDMWMQLLRHVPMLVYLSEECAIYRVGRSSMSRKPLDMWRGFHAAIEKQKACFQNDKEVLEGLHYLEKMNDYSYHHGWRGKIKRIIDSRPFRHLALQPVAALIREIVHPQKPGFMSVVDVLETNK